MSDVTVTRMDAAGMLTIRSDLSAPGLSATGLAVPGQREVVFGEGRALAWMSPDELLLICPPGETGELRRALEAGLAGGHFLVVDVSDARARFRLAGPGARAVLAKGAPIDVTPKALPVGSIRRTRLGQVAVAVWPVPGREAIDLVCFRSVADFVGAWLDVAAREGTLPKALL